MKGKCDFRHFLEKCVALTRHEPGMKAPLSEGPILAPLKYPPLCVNFVFRSQTKKCLKSHFPFILGGFKAFYFSS